MNLEIGKGGSGGIEAIKAARQIVIVTGIISTLSGFLYLFGLAGKLIVDGTVHSSSSPSFQILSAVIAILWDITLLILFAALRWQISGKSAVFAELAVVFMSLVCVTSCINWFVQLTILPKIIQGGNSTLIALIDVHNDLSIMYAVEHLGWGVFYGLATVFIAIAMDSGKLEDWIRGLFAAGGALSILHVLGIVINNSILSDLGYVAWGVLLPVTTILLTIRYWNSRSEGIEEGSH